MRFKGWFQVTLQLGLLALLYAVTAPHHAALHGDPVVIAMLSLSIVVAVVAVRAHPWGNFNVHPEPKTNGQLIQTGIYRHIRHPMYSALILFGLACVLTRPTAISIVLLIALSAVLYWKAVTEEAMLREQYPDYAKYCEQSSRFVPSLSRNRH